MSLILLDTPGYVLRKKDNPKKLELCFMGEMRETLVDVSEAFSTHFEEKKLPVLHVTKFDMIGDTEETTQVRKIKLISTLALGLYCRSWLESNGILLVDYTQKNVFAAEHTHY